MAQINAIQPAGFSVSVQRTATNPGIREAKKTRDFEQAEKVSGAQADRKDAGRFADAVSVSEDGDTVQVSTESKIRLEDDRFGRVTVKPDRESAYRLEDHSQTSAEKNNTVLIQDAARDKQLEAELEAGIVSRQPEAGSEAGAVSKRPEAGFDVGTGSKLQDIVSDATVGSKMQDAEKVTAAETNTRNGEDGEAVVDIPVSTIGRTESELQQMYLDGDISKHELDKAVELREERREQLQQEEEQFSRKAALVNQLMGRQKTDETELKNLYGQDSADIPDASIRAGILNQLEDENRLIWNVS